MREGEAEFFLKISENFSGPKQFVKLNPGDLKSPTLNYVFKSSQNIIILKLGDLERKPSQDRGEFLSLQIHRKSFWTLEKRAPGLFISLLIAVLPWNEYLTLI